MKAERGTTIFSLSISTCLATISSEIDVKVENTSAPCNLDDLDLLKPKDSLIEIINLTIKMIRSQKMCQGKLNVIKLC